MVRVWLQGGRGWGYREDRGDTGTVHLPYCMCTSLYSLGLYVCTLSGLSALKSSLTVQEAQEQLEMLQKEVCVHPFRVCVCACVCMYVCTCMCTCVCTCYYSRLLPSPSLPPSLPCLVCSVLRWTGGCRWPSPAKMLSLQSSRRRSGKTTRPLFRTGERGREW